MNAYVASVIDYVKQTHANEPEFVQTVEEVLSSVSPIMDAPPEYCLLYTSPSPRD